MIFLIEYNRPKGVIVSFCTFDDAQRLDAHAQRFDLELDLNRRGVDHEVVLLEADSEATIRRTHRRYFEDLRTLLQPVALSPEILQQG